MLKSVLTTIFSGLVTLCFTLDVFAAESQLRKLPSARAFTGTVDGDFVIADLPKDGGVAYDYPSNSDELNTAVLDRRSGNVFVYDLRHASMSLPRPTPPYRTAGYDLAALVAVTEFADINNAALAASFLLYLTSDSKVIENAAAGRIELRTRDNGSRFYYGADFENILAIKSALLASYEVEWTNEP